MVSIIGCTEVIIWLAAVPIACTTPQKQFQGLLLMETVCANAEAMVGMTGASIKNAFATAVMAVDRTGTVLKAFPIASTRGATFPIAVPIASTKGAALAKAVPIELITNLATPAP